MKKVTILLGALANAAAVGAAEVTSQSCARWEGNFRTLMLEAGTFLVIAGFLMAWIAPWIMRATGRLWRWALGVTGRSFWPGFALALLATLLWLLFVFPGPWRGELAAFQIKSEYFPAAQASDASKARSPSSTISTTRSPDCTNVNFTKRGLFWGIGAGETLAAQPFLVLAFLCAAAAAGALLARISYWIAGRLRAPWAQARRAAREGRGILR